VTDLVAQMRKTKALDFLLEHVEIVDPEGNSIDRALVMGKTEDHDHDHAHDHDHHDHDHEGHDHD
jgi:trigger factor